MDLAVLVIFFNRRFSVVELINRLSDVRPTRLYLACDGARNWVPGEKELINEIREQVLILINWDCEVFTSFKNKNLGCKYNVYGAVHWFFSEEEKGVVLEDDCIPTVSFFKFVENMLSYYEFDYRVGSISGRNEVTDIYRSSDPYFFTRKFFCWGWASWSNRVLDNDVELGLSQEVPHGVFCGLPWKERMMVKGVIGLVKSRVVNSWAYPFDLSFRRKNQLCLIPSNNLVRNIGFDTVGAHSKGGRRDMLPICEGVGITPMADIKVENDDGFMNALIEKRYPNKLWLFLFSMARYLAPIKKRLTCFFLKKLSL